MTYLTPAELAERWQGAITIKTLANWRWKGRGPVFVRLGNKIVYALSDVTSWETSRRAETTGGADQGQRRTS